MKNKFCNNCKNLSNLVNRLISALFIVFTFITTILLVRPLFFLVIVIIGALMLIEWYNMVYPNKSYLCLGLAIIFIPTVSLLYISSIDHKGWLLVTFFVLIWSVDSFAMFMGKLLKGPKLAPILSPKKTVFGFLGGIVGAIFVPLLLRLVPAYQIPNYIKITDFFFVSEFAILAILAQLSDLFISYFKRKFKIKDSGNIILGHGGVLDRFDSIILTSPVLALYLYSQINQLAC